MIVTLQAGMRRSVLVGAFAFAAMTGTAYATGLPGAASSTASTVLEKLGITVPGPNSHAGTHPDGKPTKATATDESDTSAVNQSVAAAAQEASHAAASKPVHAGSKPVEHTTGNGHGAEISALAHSTTATGADKGAVISAAASDGKSHAGDDHGQAADDHGKAADDHGKAGQKGKAPDKS
jgi:hypothetical protein